MIQVLKPVYHVEECLSEIRNSLEKGWTGLGDKTAIFEDKWKEYTGYNNCHFLNSATSALHLAVNILKEKYNWNEDDEIISTPLTFISSNAAISYEKLKVVFADVDEYLCLDPSDVIKKITNRTKAIMFVGYGGNIGQYYKIVEICKIHNLKLIFDMAHCAGTRYNGIVPGKEADMVIFSFQAVKNLPSADSGMLCCKLKEHDELARKLSWMGINKNTFDRTTSQGTYKWKYSVDYLGYKYHGNSIMAGICLTELKYLDEGNRYRRQIIEWYNDNFKNYRDIIKIIPAISECESSGHLYVVEIDNRDEVMLKLNEIGVFPGVHYISNTEYNLYSYAKGTVPNAEKIDDRIITLPIHLELKKEDIDFISKEFVRILLGNKNED